MYHYYVDTKVYQKITKLNTLHLITKLNLRCCRQSLAKEY